MIKTATILDGCCKTSKNKQGPVRAVAIWGETSPRYYRQTSENYVLGKQQLLRSLESRTKGVRIRRLAAMAGYFSIQTTKRYIDVNDDWLS